mgnify:CR=1 FL=1
MNLILRLRRANRNLSKRNKLVLFSIVLFLICLCLFFILHERAVSDQFKATNDDWSLIGRGISVRDHTIGDVDAPIQIIVYADFECKYCAKLFNVDIPKLQTEFGDQVVFAYRHFPLPIYPGSQREAEASECVYGQGDNASFWKFAKSMFALPTTVKRSDDGVLTGIAVSSGVTAQAFDLCMKEGKGKERVAEDKVEGSIAGMSTTPSLLLKSKHRAFIIRGAYYSQMYTGVKYLLETNRQIENRKH